VEVSTFADPISPFTIKLAHQRVVSSAQQQLTVLCAGRLIARASVGVSRWTSRSSTVIRGENDVRNFNPL